MLPGIEPIKNLSAFGYVWSKVLSVLTLEDVLVLLLDLRKDLWRQSEVLCDNRLGRVLNPLVQQERRILREAAAIEDQEKLSAVVA